MTNLYNYTQPLIRYELDDVLVPVSNRDTYWPFTQVQKVIGRQETTLWFTTAEGERRFIHPIVLVEFYAAGLKRFQIIQTGNRSFIFKAVLEAEYEFIEVKRRIKHKLRELLAEKNLQNVEFKVIEESEISPDSETGKYRLIKKINQ